MHMLILLNPVSNINSGKFPGPRVLLYFFASFAAL